MLFDCAVRTFSMRSRCNEKTWTVFYESKRYVNFKRQSMKTVECRWWPRSYDDAKEREKEERLLVGSDRLDVEILPMATQRCMLLLYRVCNKFVAVAMTSAKDHQYEQYVEWSKLKLYTISYLPFLYSHSVHYTVQWTYRWLHWFRSPRPTDRKLSRVDVRIFFWKSFIATEKQLQYILHYSTL